MKTLQELSDTNNLVKIYLDNPSYMSDKGHTHGYLEYYGEALKDLQHKPIIMCETGVAAGGSLFLWDKYFTHPDTIIYGVDVQFQHGLYPWEDIKSKLSSRVKLIEKNTNLLHETCISKEKFDFVLDDASHMIKDQLSFIKFFLPKMNNNGILIIEDILPDDWNNLSVPHKDNAIENSNVALLVKELPSCQIVDNRNKPRFQQFGGGTYARCSMAIIYKKN